MVTQPGLVRGDAASPVVFAASSRTDFGAACAAGGPWEGFLARQLQRCGSGPPRVPLGCDPGAEAKVSLSCWQRGLSG